MKPPRRPTKHKPMRGLGDFVENLANPIARAIDTVAGTNISGCQGCQARKARLNRMFPFRNNHPPL